MSNKITATERLFRTADGDLVGESDPAATLLAYTPGDILTDRDAEVLAAKNRSKPADKSRRPSGNK